MEAFARTIGWTGEDIVRLAGACPPAFLRARAGWEGEGFADNRYALDDDGTVPNDGMVDGK